jgi:hypothetical protein
LSPPTIAAAAIVTCSSSTAGLLAWIAGPRCSRRVFSSSSFTSATTCCRIDCTSIFGAALATSLGPVGIAPPSWLSTGPVGIPSAAFVSSFMGDSPA